MSTNDTREGIRMVKNDTREGRFFVDMEAGKISITFEKTLFLFLDN